jgi:hypothetical protein
MTTIKLIRDVINFKPARTVFVTLLNENNEEIVLRAKEAFKDKKLLEKMNREDSNRVAYLAAIELMG